MFQFDASDPDFQPATTQTDTAPRNQTRVSRHDDAWISPGFAGVTTTATITSTVSKGRASGVTVMSAASVFKSTLGAPALPTLPTGQPPKSTGHRRRSSVVLQGQKALLFVDDEPVVDEEAVEDAGDDRSRVAKSAAAATAKTTAAITNGTGATLTVADADGDRKSRSKSRKKRDRKKKQKEMSKSPAPPQLARAATPSGQRAPGTPLQRPTRIAEESPALTPRRVETLKAEEKVPTLDLKGNGTATPSSPIFIKRGLSPARSNVSSLSTSLQSQSMAAQIPQLTLNTKLGADQLVSKLSLHKCDSNSSDGIPDDAYEVPLEHDFVSSHANKKSPTGSGYGSDIDGSSGGSNSIMISRASSMVAQKRKMCAEDFEPLTMLGKGTYGTVILVRHKATGRLYAQKQLKKASLIVHKRMIEQTKTERNILESVRHPFVVKLFYAFQDHKKLYLILEYAQGGELFNYLATERIFPEDTASFYLAEIVLALDHLHRNVGVVYRDLKPENCLLDAQGHLLLTDFGLSKVAEDGARCKSLLGTPEYMAPEVLEGKTYGFEVDWWSLGALAFDLLTGSPPYPGNNNMAILNKINKTKLKLPFYLSPDSKDILTRLLRKDPSKRLGYKMPQDLQTIKKHRFFRKIDWVKLEKRELEPPIRPLITDPEKAENFATEFTEAGFSPVVTRGNWWGVNGAGARAEEDLHFGGFSFEGDAGSWGARAGYFKDFDGGCEEGNSS